jgi:RimJ/RimL family protein N-acetyltransferase
MSIIEVALRQSISALKGDASQPGASLNLELGLAEHYGLSSQQKCSIVASVCEQCRIDGVGLTDHDMGALKRPIDIVRALEKILPRRWDRMREATLENSMVLLRPVVREDYQQFSEIAFDDDIWTYFTFRIRNQADLEKFVNDAVRDRDAGTRVAFSIVEKQHGRIAGSMSFMNIAEAEKRLEIGTSWLGRDFRGTGINHWAKYLMLQHAFETLDCERVEFKTDVLNLRARKGLLNIGATEEGVLRSFNFMPDNRRRDAIFYSILKGEWPRVKAALAAGHRPRRPVANDD